MSQFQDLKYKFNNLDVFGKIIAVNVIVHIVSFLLRVLKLSGILGYFQLPSGFSDFLWQPWSLLTYGFLHADIWHLLFNMLMLFYLTRVTGNLFRHKMVLNIFFLGIISGGLLYLCIANLWSTNFFDTDRSILLGASAGVSSLLMFVGVYMPDSTIRLFNTFTVKWKHIALFFVVIDLVRILLGDNQGGYVAHLGGYLLGFYYAKKLQDGSDVGKSFERLADSFMNLFKPKSTLKTVHRKKKTPKSSKTKKEHNTLNKQKQIDTILDKISKSGYESLTAEEKEFLFRAGK